MAKPIELGLVLEGEDAEEFWRYMKNPECTEEGMLLLLEAVELAKQLDIDDI